MTEQELAEIQVRVNQVFLENLKNASGPESLVLDWKDTTILSLIAEVRRQRGEIERLKKMIDEAFEDVTEETDFTSPPTPLTEKDI